MICVMPVCVINEAIATSARMDTVDFTAERRTLRQITRQASSMLEVTRAFVEQKSDDTSIKQNGASMPKKADAAPAFRRHLPAIDSRHSWKLHLKGGAIH